MQGNMGAAISNKSDTKFHFNPIRDDGSEEMEMPALHLDNGNTLAMPPESMPVAPLFAEQLSRLCDRCYDMLGVNIWQSPDGVGETTLHLNEIQTAFLNTAGEALAQLTGKDEYRHNKSLTVIDVVRLFIMSDPAAEALDHKIATRPNRVARGKTVTADWVEVLDAPPPLTQSPAPPVEPDGTPSVLQGEIIEPLDSAYDEPAEPGDMYGDIDGDSMHQ